MFYLKISFCFDCHILSHLELYLIIEGDECLRFYPWFDIDDNDDILYCVLNYDERYTSKRIEFFGSDINLLPRLRAYIACSDRRGCRNTRWETRCQTSTGFAEVDQKRRALHEPSLRRGSEWSNTLVHLGSPRAFVGDGFATRPLGRWNLYVSNDVVCRRSARFYHCYVYAWNAIASFKRSWVTAPLEPWQTITVK